MKVISTTKAPAAIGPYSQAIRVGNLVYTSGQIPIDPATGTFVEGGIKEQTRQSLTNVKAILEEAGVNMSHVVKTTVFMADMSDFADMNAVYAEFFSKPYPARSAVAVDEGQPSADDEGRVLARLDHDLGQHGRRRGLAVGTADADAVVIHSGDGTKEVGTLEARDAGSLGGHQFGVVLEDGDGVDDDVRLAEFDVLCLLAEDDLGAQGPELVDIVSGIVVGTGHVVAVGEKDLCQGRHAGTADPDEMDSFGCFQNVIDFQDGFLHKVARIPVLDYTKTPLIIKGLVSNKWNIPPFIIVLK